MMLSFDAQIAAALDAADLVAAGGTAPGQPAQPGRSPASQGDAPSALAGSSASGGAARLVRTGSGALSSVYDVAGLASASVGAAALELAGLTGAAEVALDRRLAQMWFGMSLRPLGWTLPSPWDPVAGDYACADGWIRLHTNAPHHRDAALRVLGTAAKRELVAARVAQLPGEALQEAVVAAGGCATFMLSAEDWARHPQGRSVAAEPLIAWELRGNAAGPDPLPGPAPGGQAAWPGSAEGRAPSGLAGVRVLDLTRVLAGPVATRMLAGFGAQVLRIDPPDWEEPGLEPEVTLGKTCAGLDLRRDDDRHRFEALLAGADVLVHGYRPGALEGLGYDAATRARLAPGLIEVSLCAWGFSGPWAGRRGFDSLVQMGTGIADAGRRWAAGAARAGNGSAQGKAPGAALSAADLAARPPVPLPVQALDHATGYLMAAAVLRALRLRHRHGAALSARLSLARTAALLTGGRLAGGLSGGLSGGALSNAVPALAAETGDDLAPGTETTHWGPARRLAFPVRLDGQGPDWPYPAAPFRSSAPLWQ